MVSGMTLPQMTPAESQFVSRWVRGNAIVVLIVAAILVANRFDFEHASDEVMPMANVDPITVTMKHLPSGWRRTANGWENSSDWFRPEYEINDWITRGLHHEPVWARRAFESIRDTSPLLIASYQIFAIAVLCRVSSNRGRQLQPPRPFGLPTRRRTTS